MRLPILSDGSSNNNQVMIHNQYDIKDPIPLGTKFECIVDQITKVQNTNIGIATNERNQIIAEDCTENKSRWILDINNYQWKPQEKRLWITLQDEDDRWMDGFQVKKKKSNKNSSTLLLDTELRYAI